MTIDNSLQGFSGQWLHEVLVIRVESEAAVAATRASDHPRMPQDTMLPCQRLSSASPRNSEPCALRVYVRADFKAELHAVNREVLFGFVELLAVLTERPSASARQIESLGIALRNQLHLCNLLRPHQVAPCGAGNGTKVPQALEIRVCRDILRDGFIVMSSFSRSCASQCLK